MALTRSRGGFPESRCRLLRLVLRPEVVEAPEAAVVEDEVQALPQALLQAPLRPLVVEDEVLALPQAPLRPLVVEDEVLALLQAPLRPLVARELPPPVPAVVVVVDVVAEEEAAQVVAAMLLHHLQPQRPLYPSLTFG